MADESFGERTEQATGKRRSEARTKGQVARRREIPSVAVLLVALSVIYVLSTYLLQRLSWVMVHSFQKIGAFSLSPENILRNALPRAYFVDQVAKKTGSEIINMVKNTQFDPAYIAFTEEDIAGIEAPDSTAYVRMEKFDNEFIKLDVYASGNNFLFLGDTYMTGETDYRLFKVHTGWKAFIDGKETKIYRANHGFRGIVVPKGNHKIECTYLPESFVISKYLSLTFSSLIMLGLVVGISFSQKKILRKKLKLNETQGNIKTKIDFSSSSFKKY